MLTAFSTDDVNERDRISYWFDVASKAFFDHTFVPQTQKFRGSIGGGTLGPISLMRCEFAPCEVRRTRLNAQQDGIDNAIICIRLEGRSRFVQGDRELIVEPGMIVLEDPTQPQHTDFLEANRSLYVSVPRLMLEERIGRVDTLRTISTEQTIPALASGFVHLVEGRLGSIEPDAQDTLADQVVDLFALAFGNDNRVPSTTVRGHALQRLKMAINVRLTDPDLKPAMAAAAAGISVRYANALLAEENSSVEKYVMQRRLQCCRQALEDARQNHRTVSEIAFSWGFSDLSHFSRRFRAEFGITASQCRREALA
ncbi:helix-turn-helix domain-containing protein [Hyphomicrobium sulfonivorans]|uniref:AraC-like ligand-binding domain-containing protein n=1 Tax=Hyphomicrobium sulfonivorans TaxID=121290 RepID=UPI001570EC9A|nr:helix-turn-helix domain-containing protein [Hyphomicrobium sulfonivorans]MBI1650574.1 helix-turn-helix domain-containing protein [Hyphomicrobium sulfonivorans]NSL72067.1 hypothetical protein [Hyphomicrobium sulfonivorans]